MSAYTFEVKLSKQEDDLWRAEAPALPGCFVDADTVKLAVQGIQETVAMALDVYKEIGEPLPSRVGIGLDLPFKSSLPVVIEEHPMKRHVTKRALKPTGHDVSGA
jgi:predicted RNase H-like HicB family nuclease